MNFGFVTVSSISSTNTELTRKFQAQSDQMIYDVSEHHYNFLLIMYVYYMNAFVFNLFIFDVSLIFFSSDEFRFKIPHNIFNDIYVCVCTWQSNSWICSSFLFIVVINRIYWFFFHLQSFRYVNGSQLEITWYFDSITCFPWAREHLTSVIRNSSR